MLTQSMSQSHVTQHVSHDNTAQSWINNRHAYLHSVTELAAKIAISKNVYTWEQRRSPPFADPKEF